MGHAWILLISVGTMMATAIVAKGFINVVSRRNEKDRLADMRHQLEEDLKWMGTEPLSLESDDYIRERLLTSYEMAAVKTPSPIWFFKKKSRDEYGSFRFVGHASNRYQEGSGIETEKARSRTAMLLVSATSFALFGGLGVSFVSVGVMAVFLLAILKIQRVLGKTRTAEGKETFRYRHLLYPEEYLWLNRNSLELGDSTLGELLEMRLTDLTEEVVESLKALEKVTTMLMKYKGDLYYSDKAIKQDDDLWKTYHVWLKKTKALAKRQNETFLQARTNRNPNKTIANLSLSRAKYLKEKMEEVVADPTLNENLKERAALTLERAEQRYAEEQKMENQMQREWQASIDLATISTVKSMIGEAAEIQPRR